MAAITVSASTKPAYFVHMLAESIARPSRLGPPVLVFLCIGSAREIVPYTDTFGFPLGFPGGSIHGEYGQKRAVGGGEDSAFHAGDSAFAAHHEDGKRCQADHHSQVEGPR